jgi:ferrous iron transport protein B
VNPPVATVALVGNPNVGKSTVFNALTGARAQVGNWPGTTVQVSSGCWSTPAGPVELVDLPGTYSLAARSPAERLVRDLLVDRTVPGGPDLVVVLLDAANLARNLYLLGQVLDTGLPVVAALSMLDIAGARGLEVDPEALAGQLGVPVVAIGTRARAGRDRLAAAVVGGLRPAAAPAPAPPLGEAVESALAALSGAVAPRWRAIELLTDGGADADGGPDAGADPDGASAADPRLRPELARLRRQLADRLPDLDGDLETAVAEQRYAWVHRVVAAGVRRPGRPGPTASDRADRVLASRWLGLPAFLLVIWGLLAGSTWLAAPLQDGLGALLAGPVTDAAYGLLRGLGLDRGWVAGLVVDGLLAGVGLLLTFLPLMAIMFALLAVLEDSGYLARAAFAADRFLRTLGLPGRAFLPLVVGLGCNVPAVAATRTLPGARHRLMTGLLVPYVTCSARLVVYTMLASVFFGRHAGTVVFAMYALSVLLVVLVGLGLRGTVFRRERREALVLELPPYRLPAVRVVATQTWQRLRHFLRKAGGLIVATVMVVWLLMAIPLGGGGGFGEVEAPDSLFGGVSRTVSPVLAPAGFGDWQATGALLTGLVAKEAVVTTFGQTGAGPPERLADQLRHSFDRSSGGHAGAAVLAFLVFVLAYPPCMATVATQRAELGRRATAAGLGVQLVVAWSLATLVFQVGRLLA